MSDEERLSKLVALAASQLGEHFANVQIMVSWQQGGKTSSCYRGTGDWYARQGMAQEFINSDRNQDLAVQLAEELKQDE
jgi:hypothetical protein